MGEAIYEKREGYPGADGLVKLQLISNEEGRSIYDTANPAFQYQYMMKDHLGNVRMLLNAEEQPQLSYPDCDFEDDHASVNSRYYLNTDTYLVTPPSEFTTSQGTGAQCQLIKNNDAPVGVGKLLKVMATDEVGVKVDYYIPTTTVDNTGANPMQNLIASIISILNNTSYTGSMHGAGTAVGESFAHDVPLNNLLQQQGPANPTNLVKAYLNILFFDQQFNFICQQSQYQQLSVMGSSQMVTLLGSSMIKASANGYAYIYVSNESRNPVYIDNFQVVHKPGRIVEETHYYPFGLTMSGISSKSAGSLTNKNKFGGKELQNQEFSDGSGLETYDYGARMYDGQIGRWYTIDGFAEKYAAYSPYHFAANNPIRYKEVDGRYFEDSKHHKVSVSVNKAGQVVVGKNASADLKRMANLVNSSGSKSAADMFNKLGNNETKINFKIETEPKNNGLLGLHQAHDKDGPVKWEAGTGGTGKFEKMPDYIKGKDGNDKYKEASITVYEGNFDKGEVAAQQRANGDPGLTKDEMMVATFTHEGFHDTDQQTIDAIKTRQQGGANNYDVENAAETKAENKVYDDVKKKRKH